MAAVHVPASVEVRSKHYEQYLQVASIQGISEKEDGLVLTLSDPGHEIPRVAGSKDTYLHSIGLDWPQARQVAEFILANSPEG